MAKKEFAIVRKEFVIVKKALQWEKRIVEINLSHLNLQHF